jgi:hypothetical protein
MSPVTTRPGALLVLLFVLLRGAGDLSPAWGQAGAGVELRGQVVEITDSELVVRGDDGRLHFVNTAAIPIEELGALNPGDEVAIITRGESARGPIGGAARRHFGAPR